MPICKLGWTDGRVDGWTDVCTNGSVGERTDGQTDRHRHTTDR